MCGVDEPIVTSRRWARPLHPDVRRQIDDDRSTHRPSQWNVPNDRWSSHHTSGWTLPHVMSLKDGFWNGGVIVSRSHLVGQVGMGTQWQHRRWKLIMCATHVCASIVLCIKARSVHTTAFSICGVSHISHITHSPLSFDELTTLCSHSRRRRVQRRS